VPVEEGEVHAGGAVVVPLVGPVVDGALAVGVVGVAGDERAFGPGEVAAVLEHLLPAEHGAGAAVEGARDGGAVGVEGGPGVEGVDLVAVPAAGIGGVAGVVAEVAEGRPRGAAEAGGADVAGVHDVFGAGADGDLGVADVLGDDQVEVVRLDANRGHECPAVGALVIDGAGEHAGGELSSVGRALHALCRVTRLAQRRQKDPDQQGDDRDHHEQLDQREGMGSSNHVRSRLKETSRLIKAPARW